MAMNVDCLHWQGMMTVRQQAESMKAFVDLDRADAELTNIARKVMADPRRETAVKQDCPAVAALMVARLGAPPRQIPDPAHAAAHLETWLASLSMDDLAAVVDGAKAETTRRKVRAKKK